MKYKYKYKSKKEFKKSKANLPAAGSKANVSSPGGNKTVFKYKPATLGFKVQNSRFQLRISDFQTPSTLLRKNLEGARNYTHFLHCFDVSTDKHIHKSTNKPVLPTA